MNIIVASFLFVYFILSLTNRIVNALSNEWYLHRHSARLIAIDFLALIACISYWIWP